MSDTQKRLLAALLLTAPFWGVVAFLLFAPMLYIGASVIGGVVGIALLDS